MATHTVSHTRTSPQLGIWGKSLLPVSLASVLLVFCIAVACFHEDRSIADSWGGEEPAHMIVTAPSEGITSLRNGRAVHVTGDLSVKSNLQDETFGLSVPAVKMRRRVVLYQWEETVANEARSQLGGTIQNVQDARYRKVWHRNIIPSQGFLVKRSPENPKAKTIEDQEYLAKEVQLGDYTLAISMLDNLQQYKPLPRKYLQKEKVPAAMQASVHPIEGGWYIGNNPHVPQIGDMKVMYDVILPGPVTALGQQRSTQLGPWITRFNQRIEFLQQGSYSKAQVVAALPHEDLVQSWSIRVGVWLLMSLTIFLLMKPLAGLTRSQSTMRNISLGVQVGISLLAGGSLVLVNASMMWLFYQPILAIGIFVTSIALAILVYWILSRYNTNRTVEPWNPRMAAVSY
ncbi:Hypothetical protein PBC10988_19490 [Planctomycetales bacterium 10988]|nr:Hypothetical protein PBC10988_19490 [Planctomycetales bacterium 10988]